MINYKWMLMPIGVVIPRPMISNYKTGVFITHFRPWIHEESKKHGFEYWGKRLAWFYRIDLIGYNHYVFPIILIGFKDQKKVDWIYGERKTHH